MRSQAQSHTSLAKDFPRVQGQTQSQTQGQAQGQTQDQTQGQTQTQGQARSLQRSLIGVICLISVCCASSTFSSPAALGEQPHEDPYEASRLEVDAQPERRSKLYAFEGERRAPERCDSFRDERGARSLARYVASLQGAKAIVREHCFNEGALRAPSLDEGTCSGAGCASYDTYRRGPVYFARFFAAMNAAINAAPVEVWNMNRIIEGQEVLAEQRRALMNTLDQREVLRQRFKFKLGGGTRCVAQIKIFKDHVAREREQSLGHSTVDLSPSLSSGLLWADHYQTDEGYELLMIEHRFAEGRGSGEVFERDLLCVNASRPVHIGGRFGFASREINRDTLRIYAYPRR